MHVCFHVAEHDETVSCPRKQNIESFSSSEESDLAVVVAASQGRNDYVCLFALVVIFGMSDGEKHCYPGNSEYTKCEVESYEKRRRMSQRG